MKLILVPLEWQDGIHWTKWGIVCEHILAVSSLIEYDNYCCRKWTHPAEFKSWMRLFYISLHANDLKHLKISSWIMFIQLYLYNELLLFNIIFSFRNSLLH